jgi:hypothetical protein
MSEDKKTRVVKINQKYKDPKTGKVIEYDMTKGEMGVAVTTGPSFTTKREEARESQIALLQAYPQAMLPALPGIVRGMDWHNADKTAEAIERGLPPELRDPESQKEQMQGVPPAVQAQLQQAQQIIQQLGQALQEAQQAAAEKQSEAQMKMGELQVKSQSAKTQAEKNQFDAELKAAELQFQRDKMTSDAQMQAANLELQAQKLALEAEKLRIESDKAKFDAEVRMVEMQNFAGIKNQTNLEKTDKEPTEMQGSETIKQNMDALIQMLMQMQGNFQQLSADIRAPKVIDVKRNPQTGLIEQAYVVPQ